MTFDDSVKSHATVVAPILKELGFSATFFITEGFDFKTNKVDYMTWEEIRQLHQAGFEIGNHSRDHMSVTKNTLERLPEQLQGINEQCRLHGIPQPVSFAFPGNAIHVDALPILKKAGIRMARRGGSPEYTYDEGGGVAFEPGLDHPLLIPSAGDARPHWTLEDFKTALARARPGSIPVLQFHGVPDRQHPWVHTPPERFREYMRYLKENQFEVLAMRDLERYIDPAREPADPMARIEARIRQIKATKNRSKAAVAPPPNAQPVANLRLTNDTLDVHLLDNANSPKILSGLDSLFHRLDAPEFDAYDPATPGASAGLNFEHIISGHKNPANRFTPRQGPFPLYRGLDDVPSAVLGRQAKDCPWQVDASLKYTLAQSNAVDFEFVCAPRQADLFGERGYAVFFFANYMNDVVDPALHFRGLEGPGADESWIRAEAPEGHADYNGGGTYRSVHARPLSYDADHNFKLNLWSYDWPQFTQAFYYGRAAHDMVLMLMFDRIYSATDEIRFSLFKFKLAKFPRPAWDFQYVIHKVEKDREYGFKGRLVWKKFVSEDDCLEEYRRWKQVLKPGN